MALEMTLAVGGVWLPVAGGVAMLFLLVYVVGQCVCGKEKKDGSMSTGKYTAAANSVQITTKAESLAIDVDNGVAPVENGQAGENLGASSSSQKSPGHSPHHANQRQLPAPPQGNGAVVKSSNTLDVDDGDDDYDHLDKTGSRYKRGSNYDHVILGEDGSVKIKERKNLDTEYAEVNLENIYTPVKEQVSSAEGATSQDYNNDSKLRVKVVTGSNDDEYAMVSDEKEPDINGEPYEKVKTKEDPYAKVKEKDDPYNKVKEKDDPYNKVKEKDDPYNKVKEKEDPYNKVKEDDDPYNKVKEKDSPYNVVPEGDSAGSFDDVDPYNKVKDVDPYNKVKDVDPYSKVKDDDPYNKVTDVDPYNKVDDDPYNSVKDDDPYNRIKGDDPYNKIKGDDDPYNRVDDDFIDVTEDPKDPYSTVDPNRKTKQVTTITVNQGGGASSEGGTASTSEDTFKVEEGSDEYAVVMKNRSDSSSVAAVTEPIVTNTSEVNPYHLPPEPPRNYRGEESSVQAPPSSAATTSISAFNQSQVQNQGATAVNQIPAAEGETAQESGPRREPGYIKLTSRESMASINARRVINTYETVAETENMYATVEGGSGDGVISAPPTSSNRANVPNEVYAEIAGSGDGVVHTPPTNPTNNRASLPNDFYAEIGGSGEQQARVPAPPSLDSLHLMTKTHHEGRQCSRSSGDEADHQSQLEQVSPVAFINSIHSSASKSNHSETKTDSRGAAANTFVTLDPNYQTVRDCVNDVDGDIDPNYESVEEAKSKVFVLAKESNDCANAKGNVVDGKKRNHVYEEVRPSSDERNNQTRAMRSHMYEDIDEVQEQKRELNRKSQEIAKSKHL